jgi:hypothetical protein
MNDILFAVHCLLPAVGKADDMFESDIRVEVKAIIGLAAQLYVYRPVCADYGYD